MYTTSAPIFASKNTNHSLSKTVFFVVFISFSKRKICSVSFKLWFGINKIDVNNLNRRYHSRLYALITITEKSF